MLYSRYVLGCLEAANYKQTSVHELLCTTVGFGCRLQEGLTNGRKGAVDAPKICILTAMVRRLREMLDDSDSQRH